MFTNEENILLEAISKMFSINNEERQASEKNIQIWLQETYPQILLTCNKFIVCEKLSIKIREYSCFLIKMCTDITHYQDWKNINLELKKSVQTNALSLLGHQNSSLRNQACIIVTSIFEASVRDQGWPDLIKILCNASYNDNIEFKLSAINTLGMIWEKLPKEPFSFEELTLMEKVIIDLLNKPQTEELTVKCLNAYQYFILYIKEKFVDPKYTENTLKMLITYCNSINDLYTSEISKLAIHRITEIILLAYDFVEEHFRNISEYFIQLIINKEEKIATQAIIFFIEVSDDEVDRKMKNFSYKKYISSIWDILWPCIQYILKVGRKGDLDESCSYDQVEYLLINLSILCDESVIDDIFNYMKEKLNENDPLKNISAIYVFGSLMETVHEEKINLVIPASIESMVNLFGKNNDQLNIKLSWCFCQICLHHPNVILLNKNLFDFFISRIINLLNDQYISNLVKINFCEVIYTLSSNIINNDMQSWNLFSPFLKNLLMILENLAYLTNSFDFNNNLTEKCFIAISSLLECSSEIDSELISYFMDKIYQRLIEAQDINKFGRDKLKLISYQSNLCLVIQGLCNNSIYNIIKLDNQKIEGYFNIIENFFKLNLSIFENGLLALSGIITLISDNKIDNLLQRLMVYIIYALNNYTDAENCNAACLSLLDLIPASKEKFYPYIKEILPLFIKIINADDTKKNILNLIILVYSEMFSCIGEKIWEYREEPLNYMKKILEFSINNIDYYLDDKKVDQDDLNYFINLNKNVVDFIENVSEYLKTCNNDIQKEEFKKYIQDITEYLESMMQNQILNPSNEYIRSCLTFLINFAKIYQKFLLNKINDYSLERLFNFANKSEEENIMNLTEILKSQLFKLDFSN